MPIFSHIQRISELKNTPNPSGIFSVCSANTHVLSACMRMAKEREFPLLIESTCNQVNQFGGYMHMQPRDFVDYVNRLAAKKGLSADLVFLGGDHLGPSVWTDEPAAQAMDKSKELVRRYIRAGYKKIHLDASMPCQDDNRPLPGEIISEREAQLCAAAVDECADQGVDLSELVFVVGTEVPVPGGSAQDETAIEVSTVQETEENICKTKKAFLNQELEAAWEQTIAFVVQPGVEFSDTRIHPYNRGKAKDLSLMIEGYHKLVFEAHSTDYQTRVHLREMVEDHFAILKVGPALTFAVREALFALEEIERELLNNSDKPLSKLKVVLEKAMLENPSNWEKHYASDPQESEFQRKYSFLDRSRYYWTEPEVEHSLQLLVKNLANISIPLSLISQFLNNQFSKINEGKITSHPHDLIYGKVEDVIADYIYACGSG